MLFIQENVARATNMLHIITFLTPCRYMSCFILWQQENPNKYKALVGRLRTSKGGYTVIMHSHYFDTQRLKNALVKLKENRMWKQALSRRAALLQTCSTLQNQMQATCRLVQGDNAPSQLSPAPTNKKSLLRGSSAAGHRVLGSA